MKRTFLAKRNAFLSPGDISWSAAALALVILLLVLRLVVPGFFARLTSPLSGVGSWAAGVSENFFAGFGSASALSAANDALLAQNAALSLENRTLTEKAADFERLLGASAKTQEGIVAGVIARPPENIYDTLTVAAGSADGVVAGDLVYGPGDIPLGTVASVTEHYARITLYSASGVSTDAWIGSARTPVTLLGAGGGTFSASVPRAATVAVGDTVFASGPGAVPIGTVKRADGDPASPTLSLRISPALNLFSLTWVRIVTAP